MTEKHRKIHIDDYHLAEIKAGTDLREYARAQGLSPLPKRADRFACPWRSGADSDGFQIFSDGWKDYVTGESGDAVEFVRRLYGCDFAEAVEELARYAGIELPVYEPNPSDKKKEKEPDTGEIMKNAEIRPDVKAVYKYRDADNRLVFEVLRLEPGRKGKGKEFRQRRPDGKGSWIYNLKGIDEKPLYRLPEWLKSDDEFLFLVEGEKDVDNLFALNLKATCNSCGAGKWQDNYAGQLARKNLVIVPDNDDAGRRHSKKIIPEIIHSAGSVRVLELPGLVPKGDVSDWIDAMRNDSATDDTIREKLLKLAKSCPKLPKDGIPDKAEPSRTKLKGKAAAIEPETEASIKISGDAGLPVPKAQARKMRVIPKDIADAFMSEHMLEGMPLYRIFRGVWYCYKNGIYVQLSRGDLYSDVMTFLRRRFPDYATISSRNNVVANFEANDMSGTNSKVKFPCWLPEYIPAAEWFGMGNCILNVELAAEWLTGNAIDPGEFIKNPTPKLFSTFKVDYDYDPNAECPKFMKFIEEVQPDPAGRSVVAMMFGLMLVTDCRYEVMFILFGRAGTGKSTALDILREIVGEQNCCCLTLDKLSEKHSIHLVTEHSVNIVGDASYEAFATHTLDEGLLKSMISGGTVPAEHKHKDPNNAPTIARFLIATNTLPPFADRTDGIWDRVRIIPFNQRFRNTPRHNPNLKYEIIKHELPGVFNWALKGLAMLRKTGYFPEHPEGLKLVEEHRLNCDHERQFLEDKYAGYNGSYVLKSEVYDAYRRFCGENGYRPKNAANFGLQVKRIFPEVESERIRIEAAQPRIWRNLSTSYL